jgi:triacylglycerol lipase
MPVENTIILVHGFADNARRLAYMSTYLKRRGWNVLTPTLRPSNGTVPLEELAKQLETFIQNNISANSRVDLVGFSMGGLICRYYLQRLGGLSITDRFISISTPHNGTLTAKLFNNPGIRQMRPGSIFLKDLDKDSNQLKQISCTVLYTPMDITILPARSSIVPFASVTRFLVPVHALMVYYRPLLKTIDQILSKDCK